MPSRRYWRQYRRPSGSAGGAAIAVLLTDTEAYALSDSGLKASSLSLPADRSLELAFPVYGQPERAWVYLRDGTGQTYWRVVVWDGQALSFQAEEKAAAGTTSTTNKRRFYDHPFVFGGVDWWDRWYGTICGSAGRAYGQYTPTFNGVAKSCDNAGYDGYARVGVAGTLGKWYILGQDWGGKRLGANTEGNPTCADYQNVLVKSTWKTWDADGVAVDAGGNVYVRKTTGEIIDVNETVIDTGDYLFSTKGGKVYYVKAGVLKELGGGDVGSITGPVRGVVVYG